MVEHRPEALARALRSLAAGDAVRVARQSGTERPRAAATDLAYRDLVTVPADDAADVLEEEATEDIERLGGSEPLEQPYLRTSAGTLVWKPVRWLLVLIVAEAYTGSVLRHYEDTLAAAVSLAFFIPLLIGTGGNTGSQITTRLTRALAIGDVRFGDLFRILRKELAAAVVLGVIMAVATALRAWALEVKVQVEC
jgi:magnesium transporter